MERLEQLAGKKVNSEWSVVNEPFITTLYLPAMVLTVLLLCGCGNNSADKAFQQKLRWYNEADLHLQNSNGIFMNGGRPFTGIIYSLSPSKRDTLAVEGFSQGREDGEWKKYFTNRQLAEQRFYAAGKKTGTYAAWWPNGKQRLLYHFADGEYEGSCTDWNESGLLISNMNYSKGYESGSQQQFYDNGKIKANYIMKDGRRYGLLGTKNCVNVSDSIFKK